MDAWLTVELVPATAWWTNVRSNVTRAQWEKCKTLVKERSGSRCEICGGVGSRYPVDCHEIWEYDDENQIQTLVGLIALCPRCHEVKHLGRAFAIGNAERAIEHLMSVNGWGPEFTEEYVVAAFALHDARSKIAWTLNIDYLYIEGILPWPASTSARPTARPSNHDSPSVIDLADGTRVVGRRACEQ